MNIKIPIRCYCFCLGLLLSAVTGLAQSRNGRDIEYLFPESYSRPGSDYWASGGAGIASEALSSSPLSNPAAMSFPALSFYVEATQRFRTRWMTGIDFDGQLIVPSFVGIGFRTGWANLSFGYANTFDASFSATVLVTTTESPEGTGMTNAFGRTAKNHVLFGSVGYRYNDRLALGLTMGIHYVHIRDYIITLDVSDGGIGMLVTPSFLYSVSENVSFGGAIHYESPTTFPASYGASQLLRDSMPGVVLLPEVFNFVARYPWTIDLGIACKVTPGIELMFSTEYQHWSHVSDGYNNIAQLHIGSNIIISDEFAIRAGFFTKQSPGSYGSENFLTAGFRWKAADNLVISANGIDSHWVSSSPSYPFDGSLDSRDFRQASVSLGIGYTLPPE